MTSRSLDAVIRTLNAADVRYPVAGGLAVVAHGYVRFTADVDVVLDLEEGNVRRAMSALAGLGYRPRAPVPLEDFADPAKRTTWSREKHMTVFSLYSADHAATEVDLFIGAPLDFEQAYARAARLDVSPGVKATFVSLDDLLALKERAGRPQDDLDIRRLKAIRDEASHHDD